MTSLRCVIVTVACVAAVAIQGQTGLNGKWQGTTAQGREITLDLKVNGQRLTGTFAINNQTVDVMDGKVDGTRFSFTAARGGETLKFTGQLSGDQIELVSEGAINSVMLKRVK